MEKYINDYGKECWRGVSNDSKFSSELFHEIDMGNEEHWRYDDSFQWAFHSNLGSITVLDRRTGYGWRDVESGYRDQEGKFWLASGQFDIRMEGCDTVGDAIVWIKKHANTCDPDKRY